jgi:concanavalin A-like lectin/glucanase superfamily protein
MRMQRVIGVFLVGVTAAWSAGAEPTIYLGPKTRPVVQEAALELQRLVYEASGRLMPIDTAERLAEDAEGLVLGTPASLPNLSESWPFGLDEPDHDGYLLRALAAQRDLIVVAGETPVAARNGVYGLLEELGFGFYFSGATLPERSRALEDWELPAFSESRSPVFRVRGTTPWLTHYTGAAAWDLADYQAYVDALVRMRHNFIGIRSGAGDPFTAIEINGALTGGQALPNTSRRHGANEALATADFFAGTGQYFGRSHFGASSSSIDDEATAVAASKEMLAQALAYAKARGLTVCLGFVVASDPTRPGAANRFEARLRALLDDYPMVDVVWLWAPEWWGMYPQRAPVPRSTWDSYAGRWDSAFQDVPEADRRTEAVRMGLYALQARQLLQAWRPDVRLVVSGWGGDTGRRFTDFLPGLDSVIPRDVGFAALDEMEGGPTVSAAYESVAEDRERWPILWYERDGDQWLPQPNLEEIAGACRDAQAKGCQGLLGMHWRMGDVDEAAAYCARFAWDPALTTDEFQTTRARHLFGEKLADEIAPQLERLQDLGYRWIGGDGQNERAAMYWGPGEAEHVAALTEIAGEVRDIYQKAGGFSISLPVLGEVGVVSGVTEWLTLGADSSPQEAALAGLLLRIEYALALHRALDALGPPKSAANYGEDSLELADRIRSSGLADAMHLYARGIRSKSDLGVLATMNTKGWSDLCRRLDYDEGVIQDLVAFPEDIPKEPRVHVLPGRIVVTGLPAEGLEVRVQARPLGQQTFETRTLEAIGGTTFALAFPEGYIDAGNVEYGVEAFSEGEVAVVWPEDFPRRSAGATLFRSTLAARAPTQPTPSPGAPVVACEVAADQYAATLTWEPRRGEAYTVFRDGTKLGTVYDGWFEDTAPPSGQTVTYRVAALHIATGSTPEGTVQATIPALPLPQPPSDIRASTRGDRIVLGWQSDAPEAHQYLIRKYNTDFDLIEETYVDADYGRFQQISDLVSAGQAYTYTIAGIAPDGREGPPSPMRGVIASTEPLKPVLHLSFEDEAFLQGLAQLANNALALGGRGWAELPAQPEWNPDHALTLSMWITFEDLEGTPVLLCRGAWRESGYFLQLYNGRLRFYLAGVDTLTASRPQAGTWQHVTATYGYDLMRLYLNGEKVGEKHVRGVPRATEEPLYLGRYGPSNDSGYFVRGQLDDIRIYNVPFTPGEVANLYESTKRE